MVQQSILTLLLLPVLALCAPQGYHGKPTTTTTVAETSTLKATSTVQTPEPGYTTASASITQNSSSTQAASTTVKTSASNAYPTLAPSKGQVYFKNSCDYAVTVKQFPGPGCECSEGGEVSAGSSWNDTLSSCSSGNTALKVYKSGSSTPMQFEYGIDSNYLWYDMSFIDCVKNGDDFSQCAGSGWSMGSEAKCQSYKCQADQGKECCTQGYCDPYANGVDPDPNTGCGGDQGYTDSSAMGITIELCAS